LFPLSKRFGKDDLIGRRYRLVRQIGAGAMGTVWIAHNELLDIDVAIKVLRVDNQKADPTRLYKRLLREARAAARLGHPAIVRVFDFGQTDDKSPFIVMELLAGESLAELMTRQPKMGAIEAVQFILPIIDGLAMAHGRGIIHRDVKPENIFLARDEYGRMQPKIVDFGVARFAEAGRSLTRSGALLGTPDYMAPEQARGEPDIDHRVDIWALCIVLYELVTGRRPFARDATNYLAVLRAIAHEPAPSILNYGVGDAALWLIIERGLKKRAKDRWETMRVLGESLALWLYECGAREDALGASLKTTWLQMGLDGIKIETPSMVPPRPPSSLRAPHSGARPAKAPEKSEASFDVLVESSPTGPKPADIVTVRPVPGHDVANVAGSNVPLAPADVLTRPPKVPADVARLPTEVRERPARGFPLVTMTLAGAFVVAALFETGGHPVRAVTYWAVSALRASDAARAPKPIVHVVAKAPAPPPDPGPVVVAEPPSTFPSPEPEATLAATAPALAPTPAPASVHRALPPHRQTAARSHHGKEGALPSAKTYDFGF
jgi:serine/threonine-protein kinase